METVEDVFVFKEKYINVFALLHFGMATYIVPLSFCFNFVLSFSHTFKHDC